MHCKKNIFICKNRMLKFDYFYIVPELWYLNISAQSYHICIKWYWNWFSSSWNCEFSELSEFSSFKPGVTIMPRLSEASWIVVSVFILCQYREETWAHKSQRDTLRRWAWIEDGSSARFDEKQTVWMALGQMRWGTNTHTLCRIRQALSWDTALGRQNKNYTFFCFHGNTICKNSLDQMDPTFELIWIYKWDIQNKRPAWNQLIFPVLYTLHSKK